MAVVLVRAVVVKATTVAEKAAAVAVKAATVANRCEPMGPLRQWLLADWGGHG